ncbi:hypothetical protein L7F22_020359 [Adiantum nelumboides]|nr:hypothetical protein [Adiantum nelumboides]
MGLHQSAAHNGQVEAWQNDLKSFEKLKADYEDELRRVRSEAYQVASMYAMFQSVIFIAVAQSNRLTCSLSWCPASISIAASVAAFLVIADKLKGIGEVKEDVKETSLSMSAVHDCLEQVGQQGSGLNLETVFPQFEYRRFECAGYRYILSRDGLCALLFLTFFSFIVTCFSISTLCKRCSHC